MSKAQEIAIRVHHEKFPASKQNVPLSIPLFCWLGKKRVVVFLQRLDEDVKRVYQHGEIDTPSVGILKRSRLPGRILCSCIFLRQPGISGANNCFRTSGHLQLAEYAGDMVAHRLGTEHQLFGDGRVGIALRDEGQDPSFALG